MVTLKSLFLKKSKFNAQYKLAKHADIGQIWLENVHRISYVRGFFLFLFLFLFYHAL